MNILVVEDEEMIRKGIVLAVDWKALDCTVVGEAANGLEGLDAARRLRPDLIITDIKMPQMDGIQMLTALRESGDRTSVIILTAYDSFSYAQSALRLGAVDYLLKPFHDGELEQAVTRIHERLFPKSSAPACPDYLNLPDTPKSKFIREAMEYISIHYNDPGITIGAIAENLSISEGYLSHTFKKETGLSPMNYLTRFRIQQAAILLQDCRVRVYEVAERVGYQDMAYFSSTFKKITGVSPSDYQNAASTARK